MSNNDHDEQHVTIDVSDLPPPPNWTRADAQEHHEYMLYLWRRDHDPVIGAGLGLHTAGYSTGVALTDRARIVRGEWVAR